MNRADFQSHWWLTGLSAVGMAAGVWTPAALAQDIQWLRVDDWPEVSMGVDVEGSSEETRLNSGKSTYDYLSVAPVAGLHSTGSIYHPNLLTFDLSGDLGWNWDTQTTAGGVTSQTRDESAQLLRYMAQFGILANRNYNGTAYAAQDHTYRDYGSFNTYTVDANRYGGGLHWRERSFGLSANFGYRDETATGLTDSSAITETFLNLLGTQQRKSGQSTFAFHANDMENSVNSGVAAGTKSWSAAVSDTEMLGARKNVSWGNSLTYGQADFSGQQLLTLDANENLAANHTDRLGSYLNFDYDRSELRTQSTSDRVQGSAGVHHQLYESLASNLEAHGSHQNDQTTVGTSTLDQYGINLSENYSKRLQSWGHLSLGLGTFGTHQEQDASGGVVLTPSEAHTLYGPSSPNYPNPVYLNRPQVMLSTIHVIKADGSSTPLDPVYYDLTPGVLTQIKLNSLGESFLHTNTLSVTVSYQSESLANSAYDTFGANVSMRLELGEDIGIYSRLNWQDNDASAAMLAQTLTDVIAGMDYQRRWLRLGAEVEDYDSSFTRYQAMRLFQNFNFYFGDASTLGFDCNESFYTYPSGYNQSQYQFMARYATRLPLAISWYLDAGALAQEISGTEQLQGLGRTGIVWRRGKLSLRTGYEFNGQTTSSGNITEERVKHLFFVHLRRSF